MPRENLPRCWAIAQGAGAGFPDKHQCSFRARYIFEDSATQLHLCGTHRRQLERGGGHPGWRLIATIGRDGIARRIQ